MDSMTTPSPSALYNLDCRKCEVNICTGTRRSLVQFPCVSDVRYPQPHLWIAEQRAFRGNDI